MPGLNDASQFTKLIVDFDAPNMSIDAIRAERPSTTDPNVMVSVGTLLPYSYGGHEIAGAYDSSSDEFQHVVDLVENGTAALYYTFNDRAEMAASDATTGGIAQGLSHFMEHCPIQRELRHRASGEYKSHLPSDKIFYKYYTGDMKPELPSPQTQADDLFYLFDSMKSLGWHPTVAEAEAAALAGGESADKLAKCLMTYGIIDEEYTLSLTAIEEKDAVAYEIRLPVTPVE